jgi:hypothetical protein
MEATHAPIFAEIYEFLVSSPTPEQIIAFQPSEAMQRRVRELLAANRENRLSPDDRAELDQFETINHFISMLKIYARKRLSAK